MRIPQQSRGNGSDSKRDRESGINKQERETDHENEKPISRNTLRSVRWPERILLGEDGGIEVKRVALNMDQMNPAKVTDSRAASYIRRFGSSSWELDAIEPRQLANLVTHRHAFDLERYAILRGELETLKRQVESAINWLDLGEPLKARDTLLKAVKPE